MDPRPTRSDPNERKKRKQYEKENPHFQMQEFGLKAGVLGLMAVVALYPWEKKYEEHIAKEHPERLVKGKDRRASEGNDRWDDGGRDRRVRRNDSVRGGSGSERSYRDSGSRRSLQSGSVTGSQRGYPDSRSHRESVGPRSEMGSQRSHVDETRRRRSVDGRSLPSTVYDGYEYVPPHRGYVEEIGAMDDGWDKRSRRVSPDDYGHKNRRSSVR